MKKDLYLCNNQAGNGSGRSGALKVAGSGKEGSRPRIGIRPTTDSYPAGSGKET